MKHYNHHFIYQQDSLTLKALVRNTRKKKQIRKQNKEAEKIVKNLIAENPFYNEGDFNVLFKELTTPEIDPMRFVYHLTDSKNRLSIARLGLQITTSRSKAIYANNQHYLDYMTFYPFYLYAGNPFETDIWRIDTSLINAKWCIDPFLCYVKTKDCNAPYILTKQNIPPTALRLFKAIPTKVSTIHQGWGHLGSLEINEIRLIEHAPTARLMDRFHYDCSKKYMAA